MLMVEIPKVHSLQKGEKVVPLLLIHLRGNLGQDLILLESGPYAYVPKASDLRSLLKATASPRVEAVQDSIQGRAS